MDICSTENKEKIIEKFKEIKYNDGLILIDYIINKKSCNENFIKRILKSLSKKQK